MPVCGPALEFPYMLGGGEGFSRRRRQEKAVQQDFSTGNTEMIGELVLGTMR